MLENLQSNVIFAYGIKSGIKFAGIGYI